MAQLAQGRGQWHLAAGDSWKWPQAEREQGQDSIPSLELGPFPGREEKDAQHP